MFKINPLPPLEFLNEILELDPSLPSGLRWKLKSREHYKNESYYSKFLKYYYGKMAGFKDNKSGYYSVSIKYEGITKIFRAHRVIYSLYHQTEIPNQLVIDHIDRDVSNNKIENLRLTDQANNSINRGISTINKSGVTGVSFERKKEKWRSGIEIRGKNYDLGSFANFDDAVKARKYAEKLRDENYNFDLNLEFRLDRKIT